MFDVVADLWFEGRIEPVPEQKHGDGVSWSLTWGCLACCVSVVEEMPKEKKTNNQSYQTAPINPSMFSTEKRP